MRPESASSDYPTLYTRPLANDQQLPGDAEEASMPQVAFEFAALLTRERRDDQAAQMELVEQYAPIVERVARLRLGPIMRSHLDPEDLVQSVHLTLLHGLRENKFRIASPRELVALTVTLLRHRLAREWRNHKRQPDIILRHGQALDADLPDNQGIDPAEQSLCKDEMAHLLFHLDDLDGQLLILRLEGYSTADAGRELDMDPGVLRVRLGRVRKRLRETGMHLSA